MRTPPFNQVTVNGPSQIKVHVSEESHEVFLCCPTHVHLEKRSSEYIRYQKHRFGKKCSQSVFQIWSRDRKFSVFHFLCTSPSSFAACFTQYAPPPPSPSSDLSQLSPSSTLLWRSGNLTYRVCTSNTTICVLSLPSSLSHSPSPTISYIQQTLRRYIITDGFVHVRVVCAHACTCVTQNVHTCTCACAWTNLLMTQCVTFL